MGLLLLLLVLDFAHVVVARAGALGLALAGAALATMQDVGIGAAIAFGLIAFIASDLVLLWAASSKGWIARSARLYAIVAGAVMLGAFSGLSIASPETPLAFTLFAAGLGAIGAGSSPQTTDASSLRKRCDHFRAHIRPEKPEK